MKKSINQLSNYKTRIAKFLALFFVLAALLIPLAMRSPTFAATKPGTTALSSVSSSAYNKVTVKWKKTSSATHYAVYYKKYGTSKWKRLKTVSSKYTSYTHTSSSKYPIVIGQKYVYTVRAYNSKTKKYGNYNTKGIAVATRPNTVKLNSAKLNSAKTAVTVKWNKAGGADKYVVYRMTSYSSGGYNFISTWKKLATVSSSTLQYVDKNPVAGRKNIYTVKSYNSKTKTYGKYNTKGVSITLSSSETPTKPTVTPEPIDNLTDEEMAKQVFEETNKVRKQYGRAPFIYNETLHKAAMARAVDISQVFSHDVRADGKDAMLTIWENGAGNTSGENIGNIGIRNGTAKAAVQAWMDSLGHRAAILDTSNIYMGVGCYRNFFVQVFADANPDEKVTLTFDANGGVGGYQITVPRGQKVYAKDIPTPTRTGYSFGGWCEYWGDELHKLNSFGSGENATFYAKWN